MIEQAEFAAVRKSAYGSRGLRRRNPAVLISCTGLSRTTWPSLGAQLAPVAGRHHMRTTSVAAGVLHFSAQQLVRARGATGGLTFQIPKAAVASSPARRRLSPLDLESLGVNANLYRPRVSFIRCRSSQRGHSLAAEFCSTNHELACDAATPGYM